MTEATALSLACGALLAGLLTSSTMAVADVQQVLTIKGVIYAAIPCVINGNKPITAPFGDVQTAGIDGEYKTITLNYTLDCKRSATSALRMQIRGKAAFKPELLLIPGHENLGIALKKDNEAFAINTWKEFDSNKQPQLKAVLVKSGVGEIKAGTFAASATLVVDYR